MRGKRQTNGLLRLGNWTLIFSCHGYRILWMIQKLIFARQNNDRGEFDGDVTMGYFWGLHLGLHLESSLTFDLQGCFGARPFWWCALHTSTGPYIMQRAPKSCWPNTQIPHQMSPVPQPPSIEHNFYEFFAIGDAQLTENNDRYCEPIKSRMQTLQL